MLPEIDAQYLIDFLTALLNIPSPTGFAQEAVTSTERALGRLSPTAAFAHAERCAGGFLAGEAIRRAACPHCARGYTGRNGQRN